METISHFVNGKIVSAGLRHGDVYNPAIGEVIRKVQFAELADATVAIDAAKSAFPNWRDTSLAKRTQIMFSFREILNARKSELAAIITEEHGKTLADALGEVTRGLEVVEFATGLASFLKGSFSEQVSS
ncbi:MAG: aldehyde dehydrogenase family protein, partial [Rhodoluna sp.]